MEEIMQEVTALLQDNGGPMVYKKLYDAVSFKSQRRLYPALRQLKRAGRVTISNIVNPDTHRTAFTITLE